MIFDQFSRYKACSYFLEKAGLDAGDSILDVGSGPECFFGNFIPEAKLTYVDPLIKRNGPVNQIKGDVFTNELNDKYYDFVTAVDVLEHIPNEIRDPFIERISKLSKKGLVLGFPTSDSSESEETDKELDCQYRSIFYKNYGWLNEHEKFGLPSLAKTLDYLRKLGWTCQTVGHGYTPWLKELLGFIICVWDIPDLSNVVNIISEKFNKELYPYDFFPPHYRQFIIATKEKLKTIEKPIKSEKEIDAKNKFQLLMEEAKKLYFTSSLIQLKNKDEQILKLNQKIEETSSWAISQQTAIVERDELILSLNQKIEEVSRQAILQNGAIEDRDKQLLLLNQKFEEASFQSIFQKKTIEEQDRQIANLKKKNEDIVCHIALKESIIVDLKKILRDKHAELMKMSDWAYGMMQELNRRSSFFPRRIIFLSSKLLNVLKNKLKSSSLGTALRYTIAKLYYLKNRSTFDTIKQSVAQNDGRLVITFPIITWDFRWQRPQHIVTRLRDKGFAVIYLAMSLFAKGRRYNSLHEAGGDVCFNELDSHIHQIWLYSAKTINVYSDEIEGDDLSNICFGLTAVLSKLRVSEIIYMIQFPGWSKVAIELKKQFGGKIIFDCMDEHGGFSTNSKAALRNEENLIKISDLVITSSSLLEKKALRLNPCTIQVKNGTEFEHFKEPVANGELDYLHGKPVIGYYGAISDWFDLEIIEYCAKMKPQWEFVLIGEASGIDVKMVSKLENVHLLGEKSYASLPGYLAYFDVCTIPFKIIPLTLATNPVKFYEYLSAGKPVVSVALPELLSCKEECYISHDKEEFLLQLEKALSESKDKKRKEIRIRCAQENSWDSRVDKILKTDCFKNIICSYTDL